MRQQYTDCIKIGFISALGVLLILFSTFIYKLNLNLQSQATEQQLWVLEHAKKTCNTNGVTYINYSDNKDGNWRYEVTCAGEL